MRNEMRIAATRMTSTSRTNRHAPPFLSFEERGRSLRSGTSPAGAGSADRVLRRGRDPGRFGWQLHLEAQAGAVVEHLCVDVQDLGAGRYLAPRLVREAGERSDARRLHASCTVCMVSGVPRRGTLDCPPSPYATLRPGPNQGCIALNANVTRHCSARMVS